MAYSNDILATPGLVSYWRLGESSGSFIDSKDSNPASIPVGGIARGMTGLLTNDADSAVQGDGDLSSYIVVPDNANLRLATVTAECWAKPLALPAIRGGLVSRWHVVDSWFLEYTSSGRWRWYVRPSSGGDMQVDTGSAPAALKPQTDVRHHIVGTYSVADGARLYVNGIQVASIASTGFGAKATAGQVNLFAMDAATTNAFLGLIDEVAIYNAVLTPEQILDHYNSGANPNQMMGVV